MESAREVHGEIIKARLNLPSSPLLYLAFHGKQVHSFSCFAVETRRQPSDELKVSPKNTISSKRFADVL